MRDPWASARLRRQDRHRHDRVDDHPLPGHGLRQECGAGLLDSGDPVQHQPGLLLGERGGHRVELGFDALALPGVLRPSQFPVAQHVAQLIEPRPQRVGLGVQVGGRLAVDHRQQPGALTVEHLAHGGEHKLVQPLGVDVRVRAGAAAVDTAQRAVPAGG